MHKTFIIVLLLLVTASNVFAFKISEYAYGFGATTSFNHPNGITSEIVMKDITIIGAINPFAINTPYTQVIDKNDSQFFKLNSYLTDGINDGLYLCAGITSINDGSIGFVPYVSENTLLGTATNTDFIGHTLDRIEITTLLTFVKSYGYDYQTQYIGTVTASFFGDEQVVATVPEPGTFILIVCGLAGLMLWRRRKLLYIA